MLRESFLVIKWCRIRHLASIIALGLCIGCTTSRRIVRADVDRTVVESFSFLRAYSISPERVRWFLDRMDGSYPVFYIGFDEGAYYTRSATLRVRGNGIVERQEMREDGELTWVLDN